MVVRIPSDGNLTLRVHCDGRLPVVLLAVADQQLLPPCAVLIGDVIDVGLLAPERLPGQVDLAVPKCHVVVEVRLRRAGQPLQRAENRAVVPACVQVEIAVDLLRPHGPQASALVECQARLPDISADPGQLGPSAPTLLVIVVARQPYLVSESVVAGPCEPDFRAIRGIRDDVREIVRARVFGHAHHIDNAWIQRWLRLRIARLHELL